MRDTEQGGGGGGGADKTDWTTAGESKLLTAIEGRSAGLPVGLATSRFYACCHVIVVT